MASAAPAAFSSLTAPVPRPKSDGLETKQGPARALASEVAHPDARAAELDGRTSLSSLPDTLDARHAFVAAPLPPSRPRGLSFNAKLASMRQPIEFRLADRGNSL
jgi:hypothetical protein